MSIRIAVFSDTHSNIALMLEGVRRESPDVLIHLGDHERDADTLKLEFPEIPLYRVCGNCDICPTALEKDIVPLGPVKAFITHGHLYNVKWSGTTSLVYAALEESCKIALFGHTHEPLNEEVAGVVVVNPGTAGKGRTPTYAMLEIFENGGISSEIRML